MVIRRCLGRYVLFSPTSSSGFCTASPSVEILRIPFVSLLEDYLQGARCLLPLLHLELLLLLELDLEKDACLIVLLLEDFLKTLRCFLQLLELKRLPGGQFETNA